MSGSHKTTDSEKWIELVPQVVASAVVASLHLVVGQTLAYSGIIVPQMMEEQKTTNITGAIPITETDIVWISSAILFAGVTASVFVGVLVDSLGRLRTIMIGGVPGVVGFVLIATASSMPMIIWGRILSGVAFVLIVNPTAVYIGEISRPDVRGSLLSFTQIFLTIGTVLIYLKGWVLHWRTIAWINNVYLLVAIAAIFFVPESPAWLVSKSSISKAKESLAWFQKYSKKPVEEELLMIQNEQGARERCNWNETLRLFLLPTFYKPFLILTVIFFLQQMSGAFVILLNCVIFFEEIGTKIDPYLASVSISAVKMVMSFLTTVLMKKFRRRVLLFVSTGGMALSISTSGLFTQWLQQGVSTQTWVPLVCLMFYMFFSTIGLTWIPFMVAVEMFPLKIRGVAYSMIITVMNLFTFVALQCYFPLQHIFGGSSGLQYFFATMCIFVTVFIYLFLPETHTYKLIEIENYFLKNTTYRSSKMQKIKENVDETTA